MRIVDECNGVNCKPHIYKVCANTASIKQAYLFSNKSLFAFPVKMFGKLNITIKTNN